MWEGDQRRYENRQFNMAVRKLAGPGAGVRKYDLLTALAVAGLAGPPTFCTSMTRLIALITARYNWRLDEVTIGQAELARLWSVDPRTVKRELKRLREMGVLILKRAGVRGRVSAYALDHVRIDQITHAAWPQVGPDFEDRMAGARPVAEEKVITFPGGVDRRSDWGRARQVLKAADPARFTAWFAPLVQSERHADILTLRAPSGFHARYVETHLIGDLVRAVNQITPEIATIEILSPEA